MTSVLFGFKRHLQKNHIINGDYYGKLLKAKGVLFDKDNDTAHTTSVSIAVCRDFGLVNHISLDLSTSNYYLFTNMSKLFTRKRYRSVYNVVIAVYIFTNRMKSYKYNMMKSSSYQHCNSDGSSVQNAMLKSKP